MVDELILAMVPRASVMRTQRRLSRSTPDLLALQYGIVRPGNIDPPSAQTATIQDFRHSIYAEPGIRAGRAADDRCVSPPTIQKAPS